MAANTSNIWAGEQIGATPDGRKQGEPLSDAASPTYGRDTHCPTMTVNSLVKLDYTKVACASVVNQKFLSDLIRIPEELDPVVAATFACPGPTAIHACSLAEQAGVVFEGVNCE